MRRRQQSLATLLVVLHADDIPNVAYESEDTHLFRRVLQQSDLWLRTSGLGSQTRGEVSGAVERPDDDLARLRTPADAGPSATS